MAINKVIVIGNATLDVGLKSDEFKAGEKSLSFDFGSKSYINEAHLNLGGGALNSAFTFVKLGLETDVYFKIGQDLIGGIINSMLQEKILELQSSKSIEQIRICPRVFDSPSSFSVILLPKNKDRIILAYHSRDYHKWELKELPQDAKDSFIFLNTDETLAKVWKNYLKKLKTGGNFITINPSKPFLKEAKKDAMEILNLADIIILNYEEAKLLLGKKIEPVKLIKNLRKELTNPSMLVMTMDEKGVIINSKFKNDKIDKVNFVAEKLSGTQFFSKNSKLLYSRGFKVKKIADGTGAGDAFGSAFCGYLIKRGFTRTDTQINADKSEIDDIIKEAVRRGCANAVSVIEKTGAQAGILSEKDYQQKRFQNLEFDII